MRKKGLDFLQTVSNNSNNFTHYSQSTSKISLGDCRINNHTTINLNQCAKYKRADFFFVHAFLISEHLWAYSGGTLNA